MDEYQYNLEAQIEQLNAAVEAVKGRKIENVFFVACGGSKAIFMPVEYIFSLETEIPAKTYTAREFLSGLITVLKNMTATAKLTIHMAEITGIIQTVGHFVVMD